MSKSSNISRIKIGNYVEFGKQVKKWAETSAANRPKTIGEVKDELAKTGAKVVFPEDRFNDDSEVIFVESKLYDEWVVRLPPIEMVNESVSRIQNGGGYPTEHLPTYYRDYLTSGSEYDEEFLYSRIADYTIAQCA